MNPSQGTKFAIGKSVSPRYIAFSWAEFRAVMAKGDTNDDDNDVGGELQIADYRVGQ
jgi:hypothetical protein